MKLDLKPFAVGDLQVTAVDVKRLGFFAYAYAASSANSQKTLDRAIIRASTTLDGKQITNDQITLLPINVGRAIKNQIDAFNEGESAAQGENISAKDNDGLSGPALFRLGTPITYKTGKGEGKIEELEFQAKLYGDVEDILAAPTTMMQAVELVRKLAVPVGPAAGSMATLPESLAEKLTVADGLAIALTILPPFVE